MTFLGNKGPKNTSADVRNRLKFGKISKKDLLCTKMWKMEIENLIVEVRSRSSFASGKLAEVDLSLAFHLTPLCFPA